MAEPSIDVDRVVREVLAKLEPAPSPDATGDELVVSCSVVTLSQVAGRLDTVKRLVVPARAVVTPAVRDELIRRNVTLTYGASAAAAATVPVRLVLVAAGKRPDPTALVRALGNEGIEVQQHRSECLIAATDRLAAAVVEPHTLGLLLTGHVSAGLCLANRLRRVRAVSATDRQTAATAAGSVGANLLVLDPAAVSLFQLKQMVSEFCRAGPRPCPDAFKQHLA